MKRNSGQIFPFCVMILTLILVLVLSNFEIGFLNLRKIQQQKKMDGIAMHYASDYARALNALAGLNDGLATVRNRAWIVSSVEAILIACSIPKPDKCGKPLLHLSAKLPEFYSRINKLGKAMVNQQEQIISWMLQTRCQAKTELQFTTFSHFQMYPVWPCSFRSDYAGLPFYRPYDDESNQENQGVQNCKTATYTSHNEFKNIARNLANQPFEESAAQFKVEYESIQQNRHYERPKHAAQALLLPYSMQQRIQLQTENFTFKKAEVTYCAKFGQILGSITKGIPLLFKIPAPLVFKPEFFSNGNKMIFLASDKIHSDFKKPLRSFYQQDSLAPVTIDDNVWGLTETIIRGEDFRRMEFKPQISAVTLQNEVTRIAKASNPLVKWPNLIEKQHEIIH